jgi:hypothetical protein
MEIGAVWAGFESQEHARNRRFGISESTGKEAGWSTLLRIARWKLRGSAPNLCWVFDAAAVTEIK